MKVIYFGTARFAVPPLEALLSVPGVEVVLVVTQPDRPFGRKQESQATPVAEFAKAKGLKLYQPESLRDETIPAMLGALEADIFITAAYGKIVPQAVLDVPPLGCLNLHGSILPKYRGASPIQAAIAAGETETGVSLMKMDADVDHGPVYATATTPISTDDTYATLEEKLARVAADLLVATLPLIANGTFVAEEQDHSGATFTTLVQKEHGRVRWTEETAAQIECKRRAYTPWPGIFMMLPKAEHGEVPPNGGKGGELRVKLLEVAVDPSVPAVTPGTVYVTPAGLPAVRAREGGLVLTKVQPEGKGAMDGKAFLNGYKDFASLKLG